MPPRFMHLWLMGLFALALFAMAIDETLADQHTPVFDVYSLTADADADVTNDLMTATLAVQAEHTDPAKLAGEVNEAMNWALEQLAEFPEIETETLGYQTWPRYSGNAANRIIGWRASQTLQLKTSDFERASEAIRVLQSKLNVQNIVLGTRRNTRRTAENRLIEEALAAFRERALLIQNTMGAGSYRIVDINVDTDSGQTPVYRQRGVALEADSAVTSAPAIAAGSSRVVVRVHGRIQLDR